MEVIIKLKRIELKGKLIMWNKEDAGFKNYAGDVYFENHNYSGFLNHDGTVKMQRNFRNIGNYKPKKGLTLPPKVEGNF